MQASLRAIRPSAASALTGSLRARGFSASAALPVLNYQDWREESASGRDRFCAQLQEACTQTGFFYLRNHGLEKVMDEGMDGLRDFFALPVELKQDLSYERSTVFPPTCRGWQEKEWLDPARHGRGDTKQTFQMGYDFPQAQPPTSVPFLGPNLWPDRTVPHLRAQLSTVFSSLHGLGMEMCRAFAQSVGAQDRGVFARECGFGSMTMARGLYYPEANGDPDEVGCSAHTDYGVLTLLHQTGAGLQVLRADDSEWLEVPALEGHLICNIADLMERWTNGKYVSSVHRVMVPPGAPARYSYGFFLEANFDTIVAPIEECCKEVPVKYDAIKAGDHKLKKTRIQYGQDVQSELHLFSRTLTSANKPTVTVSL